ncbi:flagellar basal body-associated FliL family protein [Marivivens donghaensis]|uniref:Flagellar protein FliL n=1 Tax=Marivivens donghaensis TaxID=1699413 RepID=A0ABX0VU79_9RHOB|nr:flagellar basal body-associated FliL family protein [Marivivens donghaensis]NIY71370.1 flagellar basal body-associated FliL family protein [Marivivens donghaensis]
MPDTAQSSNKKPLIIGAVLALIGGAGGYAATAGMLPEFGGGHGAQSHGIGVAFVPVDPLIVSLPDGKHLRFTAQLEVTPGSRAEVESLSPRIVDIFNSFLRAVQPSDFEDPVILEKLRSHLLHRARLVTGESAVKSVLIMEFVLD